MNSLPFSDQVSVGHFSRIFDSTSASYKFLLFKSLLESVKKNETVLSFDDLALKCFSQAWYSIHFYKLSFGKSDKITDWVSKIDQALENEVLISDLSSDKIYSLLSERYRTKHKVIFPILKECIKDFSIQVPYRLIAPWYAEELRGKKT